ncbi:MAG: cytochrome-c peroxidase [Gammaproteobacteria bacterium]|nr:cytochrome-c peroxidase [Gammaproteobacteria bacterium]
MVNYRLFLYRALLVGLSIIGVAATAADIAVVGAAEPPRFVLRTHCPPSFEKLDSGLCKLRTRYEMYTSVQDKGLGGTMTSLPDHRDGFTPQQIDLGRYLFFDPLLSRDGSVSCASCHDPDRGFSDGLPRSVGIGGAQVARAAPTLWNVAFLNSFFWDAHAQSLEQQAMGPLFSPVEMGNTPVQLAQRLNDNAAYRALFRQAFPESSTQGIRLEDVYTALAAFQTSLISLNSRYDRYAHGHHAALSAPEIEGLNIFRSFVARCAECHTPPLFTNQQIAVIGAPEPPGLPFDPGAEKTFNAPKLRGGFKVPTLRNIELTAPYMHSGLFGNLRDTAAFYNGGRGHAVPAGEDLFLHWHISSPELTDYELDRLVDFLGTLTDESLKPQVPDALPSGLSPLAGPATQAAAGQSIGKAQQAPQASQAGAIAGPNARSGMLTTKTDVETGIKTKTASASVTVTAKTARTTAPPLTRSGPTPASIATTASATGDSS